MTMRGLLLISVCLANVLTARAECCKCDCQQSGLQQPQFYYLPVAPPHLSSSGQGIYQSLGHVQGQDAARFAQIGYHDSYQSIGSATQGSHFHVAGTGIDNSIDAEGKISQVSTHHGNHYINIEKQVISQGSSNDDIHSLEHEKDHDHGKNDFYKFEYAVNDQHTHDIKSHKEEKKGDVVQGEYSLVEEDGNVRTVKYYADWKTGFHAQVHNSKTTALG